MGLDNGIIIKGANAIKEDLEKCPCFEWDKCDAEQDYQHIAYWRKCWGVRDAILKVLHAPEHGDGEFVVEYDDVPAILRAIKPFLKEKKWEEDGNSIWEYDDFIDTMVDIYIKLTWLADYMNTHKDLQVYFYDSY